MRRLFIILFVILSLAITTPAHAGLISRVKTWVAEVLKFSDLNAEIDNIHDVINGGLDDANIEDGTLTNAEFAAAAAIAFSKLGGTTTSANAAVFTNGSNSNLEAGDRHGVRVQYDSAAQLTITEGAIDINGLRRVNTSALTVTWADIDTGAEANSTVYYVYVTADTSNTAFAELISASSSTPTGATNYRLIGKFRNGDGIDNLGDIIEGTVVNLDGANVPSQASNIGMHASSYTGSESEQIIQLGFTPIKFTTKSTAGQRMAIKLASQGTDVYQYATATGDGSGITFTGTTVVLDGNNTEVNDSGKTYYYFAIGRY